MLKKSYIGIVLGGLLIGVIVLAIIGFFYYQHLLQSSNNALSNNRFYPRNVIVTSTIPDISISILENERRQLDGFFDAIGITSFQNISFLNYSSTNIKQAPTSVNSITINIHPLSRLTTDIQNNSELAQRRIYSLNNDTIFFSGSVDETTNSYHIPLYVDIQNYTNYLTPTDVHISQMIISSLYFNFVQFSIADPKGPLSQIRQAVTFPDRTFITFTRKKSMFHLFSKVYAAEPICGPAFGDGYCISASGTQQCGSYEQKFFCINNDAPYNTLKQCTDALDSSCTSINGNCQLQDDTSSCVESGYPSASCAIYWNAYSCLLPSCGICTISTSNCNFVCVDSLPAATPTRTPTPTGVWLSPTPFPPTAVPTAGPTPTPNPVCATPVTQPPILGSCSDASGVGNIQWRWNAVAGASNYGLAVVNASSGATVIDSTWRSASTYGCAAGGTCSFTTALPAGIYYSQIRAVGASCSVSAVGASPNMTIPFCPATIQVVSKQVTGSAPTCTDVTNSTDYVSPVTYSFGSSGLPVQSQSGSSPVVWNNVTPGTFTLNATNPPAGNVLAVACWSRTNTAPLSGSGLAATVGASETLSWQLGYRIGAAWARVVDGDAHVCQNLSSPIPDVLAANQRVFVSNQPNGTAGVVYYGSGYDFNPDPLDNGRPYVSNLSWLVSENTSSPCTINWYQYFLNKYSVGGAPSDYTTSTRTLADFPSRTAPYKVEGDLTTSGSWNVAANNTNIVILVNGNLTINGPITIPSRSFLSFIVNGNITVSPSVGTTAAGTSPNLEGVFITSPTGQFNTGASTNPGTEKLIVNGMVIAGGFNLQRDLDSVGANNSTPAEEFRYNPMLLMTLPNEFMDIKLQWGEANP